MANTQRYGFTDIPIALLASVPGTGWTTVSTQQAALSTALVPVSTSGFPSLTEFDIIVGVANLDGSLTNAERMRVTDATVSPWVVVRGDSSLVHAVGESIYHELSATGLLNNPGGRTTTGDLDYLGSDGRLARLAAGADRTVVIYASGLPVVRALQAADLPDLSATYVTPSSVATFTNKSGNISQWTNDAGYLTSGGTIGGTIAAGQVPVGTAADTIGAMSGVVWTPATLTLTGTGTQLVLTRTLTTAANDYNIFNTTATFGDPAGRNGMTPLSSVLNIDATSGALTNYTAAFAMEIFDSSITANTNLMGAQVYMDKLSAAGTWAIATGVGVDIYNEDAATLGDVAVFRTGGSYYPGTPPGNYGGGTITTYTAFHGTGVNVNGTYGALYGLRLATQVGPTVSGNNHAINYADKFVVDSAGNVVLGNGLALRTTTTTGQTALFQAYDVDNTTYRTFATLTNGNTPSFALAAPAGGLLTGDFSTLALAGAAVATQAYVGAQGFLTSVTAHNLLSATHGDTLTDSVVRGDMLYGNATPKWARLPKPSVLSGLSHDGTDVLWVTASGTGAPVRATSPTFVTPVLGNATGGTLGLSDTFTSTIGTITTNHPALSATQTWNASGVTFQGIVLNVTNTASAAASRLLDLQVGGATKASVTVAGTYAVPDGGVVVASTSNLSAGWKLLDASGSPWFYASANAGQLGRSDIPAHSVWLQTSVNLVGAAGSRVSLLQATTTVTCNSGTSIVTATNLIPAGSQVVGVVSRVTTVLAGALLTTWQLGDGTTTNAFASTQALTAGTTSTFAQHLATWTPKVYAAATSVVMTANVGQFDSGVVRITVYYYALTAPTS